MPTVATHIVMVKIAAIISTTQIATIQITKTAAITTTIPIVAIEISRAVMTTKIVITVHVICLDKNVIIRDFYRIAPAY